jgi:hypothetical protein
MTSLSVVRSLVALCALALLAACGGGSGGIALSPADLNLVFVVSPDLAHSATGDVAPATGNLTSQGLQRSLQMGTYLQQDVLGQQNVVAIHALSPYSHLQTAGNYPDLAALGYIQQFALRNQITLRGTTAFSYDIGACYGPGAVPEGAVQPSSFPQDCRGLDYADARGNNVALATGIIDAGGRGSHVFSAPWDTTIALLGRIRQAKGYTFELPSSYPGPNVVLAIAISPQGAATLRTFDAQLNPPATYPVLPSAVHNAACNVQQPLFSLARAGGVDGVVVPPGMNRNATVHLIRHAEAHPAPTFDDGNYVGAGQWRALALPDFLRGRIRPDRVYSIDPAQAITEGSVSFSYVRPSLTAWPYAIANNLPFELVTGFILSENPTDPTTADKTLDFFFRGGRFSGQTILVAWEHAHYPPLITALLQKYGGTAPVPALAWPHSDYDTIWTVRLDASGNVTVDNALCEGIDSASLPAAPPVF